MLSLLGEARIYRPQLAARFVLNRCGARTVIARETAETLADHDPPVLASRIGQRVAFADAARSGRLVSEINERSPGAREITALCAALGRIAPCRTDPKKLPSPHVPQHLRAWRKSTDIAPRAPPKRANAEGGKGGGA